MNNVNRPERNWRAAFLATAAVGLAWSLAMRPAAANDHGHGHPGIGQWQQAPSVQGGGHAYGHGAPRLEAHHDFHGRDFNSGQSHPGFQRQTAPAFQAQSHDHPGAGFQTFHRDHPGTGVHEFNHEHSAPSVQVFNHQPGGTDPRRFDERRFLADRFDRDHWQHGHWFHGLHDGRTAWWWAIDGGGFYAFDQPIYPYPDYSEDYYAADPYASQPLAESPYPTQPNVYYYCQDPPGYYPTVQECPGGWQTVPAQPNS